MKILKRLSVLALGAVLIAGCAGPRSSGTTEAGRGAARTVDAEVCIMSGRPVDADAPTSDFSGKKIKFCCANCKTDWDALPESIKSTKMATRR